MTADTPDATAQDIAGRLSPARAGQMFYIIDMRAEWKKQRYLTLWRPDDAGYCWSLPWAGKYDLAKVDAGGSYYATRQGADNWTRFPVPCEVVEALATEQPRPGAIDGDVGPILRNLAPIRARLLKAARLPIRAILAAERDGGEPPHG